MAIGCKAYFYDSLYDFKMVMTRGNIRCALVTLNPFPIGNVATIRYSSYMAAIANAGCYSKVYVYAPSRTARFNTELSGVHNGIHYEYTSGKITLRNRNVISILYYLIVGIIRCCRSIVKDDINVLILGNTAWPINLLFKILCRKRGVKFYGERSEYPFTHYQNNKIKQWVYIKKIRWFDGMILMTEELVNYYSSLLKWEKPTFLLPMTIDCHRFDNVKKVKSEYEYIAVVFGVHNRDGLLESIQAYNKYRKLGGTYHLLLIGNYDGMPNRELLDIEVCNGGYNMDIHIKGLIPNDKLPQMLLGASCLMTTPKAYISGGFPTKLGEYMLSGVPIVATAAGDVLKYVEADKEIKISNPMDIDSVANNLLYIEQNKKESNDMACRAAKKAKKAFNAETYVQDLLAFLVEEK